MSRLVLGTRGSALALWQARHVATRLRSLHAGLTVEERIIKTEGDLQQEKPIGAQDRGVFVRRIEEALLAGDIDFAVHSLKDLPTEQPAGLAIAAVPERHDPRDVLLSRDGWSFEELPEGTAIGTCSFRRRTQLLHARSDLRTVPLRGNVDTRVRKVREGELDAVVLALAGLQRLGIDSVPMRAIEVDLCLPAVGQGALAIEARESDAGVLGLLAALDNRASRAAVAAERGFLRRLGGGCLAPAAAHATVEGDSISVRAIVGDADGHRLLRDVERGSIGEARAAGERLADRMVSAGAAQLLEASREAADGDGKP